MEYKKHTKENYKALCRMSRGSLHNKIGVTLMRNFEISYRKGDRAKKIRIICNEMIRKLINSIKKHMVKYLNFPDYNENARCKY